MNSWTICNEILSKQHTKGEAPYVYVRFTGSRTFLTLCWIGFRKCTRGPWYSSIAVSMSWINMFYMGLYTMFWVEPALQSECQKRPVLIAHDAIPWQNAVPSHAKKGSKNWDKRWSLNKRCGSQLHCHCFGNMFVRKLRDVGSRPPPCNTICTHLTFYKSQLNHLEHPKDAGTCEHAAPFFSAARAGNLCFAEAPEFPGSSFPTATIWKQCRINQVWIKNIWSFMRWCFWKSFSLPDGNGYRLRSWERLPKSAKPLPGMQQKPWLWIAFHLEGCWTVFNLP